MSKKRVLASVLVVSLLTIVAVGALTSAYFTDEETSQNNYIETGTIDIAVDDTNPWSTSMTYNMDDMKPGYVDYTEFTVTNVGSNPANVWKNLSFHSWNNDPVSEPECLAENGTWTSDATYTPYLGYCTGNTPVTNLEDVVYYDLAVQVYDAAGNPVWNQKLYDDADENALSSVYDEGNKVFLGMIPSGWSMKVTQGYHMDEDAGNEYQGDTMQYDINLYAEQLRGNLTLENKDSTSWLVLSDDGRYANLSYGVKEATFDYTLNVYGMNDGTYSLIAWADPTYAWNWANRGNALMLGTVTVSGGTASVSGSVDLGQDLIGAKIWLVPGTYVQGNASTLPWNPTNTLFETGLVDYYDSL